MNKSLLTTIYLVFTLGISAQTISEICPSNTNYFEMGFDRFPDWIELYNETDELLSMEGYSLSDDIDNLSKWTFTSQEIAPSDFLIISAEKNSLNPAVIAFSFKKKGETVYLTNPEGVIVDSVQFPTMETDDSYGRIDENWYFFDLPTPGTFNWLETAYKGYATSPDFSKPSGYYNFGTQIQIHDGLNNEAFFYSLNGEDPLESEPYLAPIVLSETMTIASISKGDSLIDSPLIRNTYFVGAMSHGLPIVNLCLDSLILFDDSTGICMPGPNADSEFPFSGANFWGDEKVNGWFQYFDENFQLLEELPVELSIHGGSGSRVRPMKSFQLHAKSGKFESRFFDEKPLQNQERILLRNAGNDYCNTCMLDGNLHDYLIKSELDVDLQAFSPTIVYINGNYFGMQNIREKVDRHYLASNYEADPKNVNILEGSDLGVVEGTAEGFEEIVDYVTDHDLSKSIHYAWMKAHIDMTSLVDYFIIELYVNNRDWPSNNLKLWNAPEHPKWRYFCYDLDASFNYRDESLEARENLRFILDNHAETNSHIKIFNALLQNEQFKVYFINRYADLLNTVFIPESMLEAFNMHRDEVEKDMNLHYTSWCTTLEEWQLRFERTYGFVHTRPAIIYNELKSVFEQNHTVEIAVDTYPYNAGTIKLNTLNLKEFPFSGRYFDETPIQLEAIPHLEGNFLYWQNARTGERIYDKKIILNPRDGDRFVAIFSFDNTLFDLTVVPNPVQQYVTIRFFLPNESEISLHIFDAKGNLVRQITDFNVLPTGNQFISWNTETLHPGMYTVRLTAGTSQETTQLIKL